MWGLFDHYHYLTNRISTNGKYYVGFINKEPVAFVSFIKFPHPTNKNIYKLSRIVTIPHWQGYGIGMKMAETITEMVFSDKDVRLTTTLPIIHNYLHKSNKWVIKAQGIRKDKEVGWNAGMATKIRACYTETYQFVNKMLKDRNVKRYGDVPKELLKDN